MLESDGRQMFLIQVLLEKVDNVELLIGKLAMVTKKEADGEAVIGGTRSWGVKGLCQVLEGKEGGHCALRRQKRQVRDRRAILLVIGKSRHDIQHVQSFARWLRILILQSHQKGEFYTNRFLFDDWMVQ
jgi:hypothetical protein